MKLGGQHLLRRGKRIWRDKRNKGVYGTGKWVLAAGGGQILNKQIHGGPDNVMLWMRATGMPGHAGIYGAVLMVLMVVVIFWAAFVMVRRASQPKPAWLKGQPANAMAGAASGVEPPESDPLRQLAAEKAALVRQIAELDRGYKDGLITEPSYNQIRAERKEQLLAVTRQLKSLEGKSKA